MGQFGRSQPKAGCRGDEHVDPAAGLPRPLRGGQTGARENVLDECVKLSSQFIVC